MAVHYCLDMSSLRHICFDKSDIGDEAIVSIAHGSPHLTKVILFDCDCITDTSMIALGENCSQLVLIDISRCNGIPHKGLTALADARRNITGVNVPDMQHGFSLRRIRISHNDQITDIGISAVGRSCPLVKEIDFSHCGMISGMGISAIAKSCPLLIRWYKKLPSFSNYRSCLLQEHFWHRCISSGTGLSSIKWYHSYWL